MRLVNKDVYIYTQTRGVYVHSGLYSKRITFFRGGCILLKIRVCTIQNQYIFAGMSETTNCILVCNSIICYIVHYKLSPVRLSVRLSHGWMSKTVEVRIMHLSPQSSPMTRVSSWLTSPRNSKGNTGSGGPMREGKEKYAIFRK